MLSNTLDFEPYRQALARDGVVQVPDVLQPEAAQALTACLQNEVRFTLAVREQGRSHTVDADTLAALGEAGVAARVAAAREEARTAFGFAYESYMLVRARREGRDPGLLLHAVLDFFNDQDFLGFARWFGGDPSIRAVNAQATRYRPGHFLTLHDDEDRDEGRRFAYVLNLTLPGWDPAWGGLLRFPATATQPERQLLPRLAITGWWLEPPPA